jgi:hypothetical protein
MSLLESPALVGLNRPAPTRGSNNLTIKNYGQKACP